MIQRIQTLFLLGVVLVSISLFFIPFSEKTVPDAATSSEVKLLLKVDKTATVLADGTESGVPSYPIMILNLLVLAAATFIIFQYKNRKGQMKLCMLSSLLSSFLLVLVFFYSEKMGSEDVKAHYLLGVYLVAVQVFLLLAARRYIRKDEKLVRAADRIR